MVDINGVCCYVGTPTATHDPRKALIFLTDMFGLTLRNNLLLVDDFARKGYLTIAPDYLNGDPAPPYAMNNPNFTSDMVKAWVQKHLPSVTRPPVDKVVQGLRDRGVTTIAVTGYCFGGRYAVDLACDGVADVVIVSHPSQLVPKDFEPFAQKAKAPLLLEMGDQDVELTVQKQEQIDAILGDGKYAPGYKRECWPGCAHGFAVRGDPLAPQEFEGKKGSFDSSVAWLRKYF